MIARDAYVHSGGGSSMSDADPNDAQYAVEVDGNVQSEHVHFADAIKAAGLLGWKEL